MNVTFTRCQDRVCPQATTCQRYDPCVNEAKHTSYFTHSPRNRDGCNYYAAPVESVAPLTSEWPVDPEAT